MACCFPRSAALEAPAPAATDEENPPDRRRRSAPLLPENTNLKVAICLIVGVFMYIGYWAAVLWGNHDIETAKFQVDSLSFSTASNININSTEPNRTAEWNAQISVMNPANHHRVSFRDVHVSVWYNNATELLSAVTVENFRQGPNARTELRAQPTAPLGNCGATEIFDNVKRDGVMVEYFGLRVSAQADYRLRFTLGTQYFVTAYDYFCKNLKLGFSPTSGEWKTVGGPPECPETVEM